MNRWRQAFGALGPSATGASACLFFFFRCLNQIILHGRGRREMYPTVSLTGSPNIQLTLILRIGFHVLLPVMVVCVFLLDTFP